jgi:hypothetical protein
MLSNFSAKDWDKIELEVFRPLAYEQPSGPDPEPWQSRNYLPDEDSDAFLPEPFPSAY